MWRVILLVFCYHVMSQPVADEPSSRHTRELIECCPCPGSKHGGPNTPGRSSLGRASVDDCPCRLRSADSEGASSMLFPTRTAAKNHANSVPFMRSNDPIDIKNLLEPEVGLAKSMLQTLREATEEEYRDALARDAARSSDAIPEESARNVVIIVKPRASDNEDDFVSEASNVKEARCINPISTQLGKMRTVTKPFRTLPDLFKLPKARSHKNLWDIDNNVGASNVQENIVDINGEAAKSNSQLFKFRTPLKENYKGSNNDFKTPSFFDKLQESVKNRPNLLGLLNLPVIPKMKIDNPLQKDNDNINTKSDLSPASSIIKEIDNGEDKGLFKLNKTPIVLKNLLKLKDVEFIPRTIPKIPLYKSKLSTKDAVLSTHWNKDDKCEDSTYDSAMNEKVLMPENDFHTENKSSQEKNIPNGELLYISNKPEEIKDDQDALTSPSEIIPIISNTADNKTLDSNETDCTDFSLEVTTIKNIINILEDIESNEKLNAAVESEIEDFTEKDGDEASKNCITDEVLEAENEDSDPEIGNSINNENVILPTFQDSQDLKKSEQGTIEPTNENSENTSIQKAEDVLHRSEQSSESLSKQLISNITPIPPLSKTLSTIRDNVRSGLENLKITQNKIPALSQQNSKINKLKTDTPITEYLDEESQKDESTDSTNSKSKVNEKEDQVTFKDLQKLSDDLLVSSSNNEQNLIPKQADETSEADFKSNEAPEQTNKNERGSFEAQPITLFSAGTPSKNHLKPKDCGIDFDDNKTKRKSIQQLKSVIENENIEDMSVEASTPIANNFPAFVNPLNSNEQLGSSLFQNKDLLDPLNLKEKLGSSLISNLDPLNLNEKLRSPALDLNESLETLLQPNLDPLNIKSSLQNLIVQPAIPDDPLNLLGNPIKEVLKLPTLEDLRQSLSSVFNTNDRRAENNLSAECGDTTNDNPIEMLPAASTNDLRKVPFLRPLEDVDILQLNPLSKPELFSTAPRLNLNNFRAKLPIPKNLDSNPVKLESKMGNSKDNVLGALLTLANDKATLRKPKPNQSNLLGYPLGSLPSLDELRNTLHSGTQNLLSTPLHSNLDLFKDSSFRAKGIPDLDQIRRNAEKTIKSLQRQMKSTLKSGKNNTPITEKFAKPQDLLEDVNDKLKAIHYDFNDRLSSIHEDILDKSKLKPLAMPWHPTFLSNRNTNHNNFLKTKEKPARLQTSASTISSQEINPFETTNNRNLMRLPGKSSLRRVHTDANRSAVGAESSPVVSKVEFPKPETAVGVPKKLTLLPLPHLPSLRQGSESLPSQNTRGKLLGISKQPSLAKNLKRPTLRKPSSFKDKTSKVTITFATTTASPVTGPMNKFKTTSLIKADEPDTQKPLKETLSFPRSKTLGNPKQSASQFTPSIIPTPVKSKDNFKTATSNIKSLPRLQSLEPTENTKPSPPNYKDSKLRLNANRMNSNRAFDNNKPEDKNDEVVTDETKAKPLVWPEKGEESFLAKVREAMQARLNSFNPAIAAEPIKAPKLVGSNLEMMRSASEKNEVIKVIEEPLKENVSYKCRMVCTREK